MSDDARVRPKTATTVGLLLLVEGLGMIALAVWLAFGALGSAAEHIAGGLFLAVLAAGAALFLALAGKAMLDGRAWSRSAAVVWSVLQLGVALGTFDGGEGPVWLALILAGLSAAIFIPALRASVTGWLRREE
ncbi:hypothetical protein [Agrococcus sp. TSP3-2-1]|uniref:hypothetical protein n=1 Tax=Agrococcus sp. TSP3-2-1 TaxID=2804583 RepID=UPI003CFB540E